MLFQSYFAEILSELEGISEDQILLPQTKELPPEVTVAGDATISIKKLYSLSIAYECMREAMIDRNASEKEFDAIEMKLGILDNLMNIEIRFTFPNIPSGDIVDIWTDFRVFHYKYQPIYPITCPSCALRIAVIISDTSNDEKNSPDEDTSCQEDEISEGEDIFDKGALPGEERVSDLDQNVEGEIPVKKVVLN